MKSLSTEYQRSWTGRGRRAYTLKGGDIKFTVDFQRWLKRLMLREGEMILKREVDSEHLLIMFFVKDDCEKSAVRCVAEAILELGNDPEGVSNAAINFAIPGKPLSGGQRFRELVAAYRRQWPGMEPASMAGSWLNLAEVQSHTFSKNRYTFTRSFLQWLRTNIDDIEAVCYPVQTKKRLPIDIALSMK
jgi:hypothetical protein